MQSLIRPPEQVGDLPRTRAGEEPLGRLAADTGFARFRRVAETPFNIVYGARR